MSAASRKGQPVAVGIDLSLTDTGIATVFDDGTISTARVRSTGAEDATLHERWERLRRLRDDIEFRIGYDYTPVVIEQPAYGATNGSHHDRSGLWWMVVDNLLHWNVPVTEVAPTTLKKYATGKGNASKDEVLAAVVKRYPAADVVNNNVADAVVLAAMGARYAGFPVDELSLQREEAFSKVRWAALLGGAA